ncbi:hypothetical protein F5Y18DRAFT_256314 [Xylariaceae sp. FL1019]|nr:hypothetical protein F5Y18DRAFT_256314 [Xylariaceae sp. FL1019]
MTLKTRIMSDAATQTDPHQGPSIAPHVAMASTVSGQPSSSRQAQESQAQTSQSGGSQPTEVTKAKHRFCSRIARELFNMDTDLDTDTSLLPSAFKSMSSTMEFDPKPPNADPDALLELIPAEEMQELAELCGYSDKSGLDPEEADAEDDPEEPDPWSLFRLLTSFFNAPPPPGKHNRALELKAAKWRIRRFTDEENKVASSWVVWPGPAELRWEGDDVLEDSAETHPHVKIFLELKIPLHEAGFTFGEVWVFVAFAYAHFRLPRNDKFKNMPITIVSTSGRDFRIVQGWADSEKKVVNVRKTEIIHLGDGEAPEKDPVQYAKILTLMRWVISEPIPGKLS